MASLTIRNLDEGVKRALRLRAARRGVSMEEEAREILRSSVGGAPEEPESVEQRERRIQAILALGRRSEGPPFDLKAFSDALSDGSE